MPPVIVFDWDQTITAEHMFKSIYMEDFKKKLDKKWRDADSRDLLSDREFVIDFLMGGEARLKRLHNFLREMDNEGAVLTISSNGFAADISLVLLKLVLRFNTPYTLARPDGSSFFSFIHARDAAVVERIEREVFRNAGLAKSGSTLWLSDVQLLAVSRRKVDFILELRKRYGPCIVFVDDDAERTGEYRMVRERDVTTVPMPTSGGVGEAEFNIIRQVVLRCVACKKPADSMCGKCTTRYCSETCQRKDYAIHNCLPDRISSTIQREAVGMPKAVSLQMFQKVGRCKHNGAEKLQKRIKRLHLLQMQALMSEHVDYTHTFIVAVAGGLDPAYGTAYNDRLMRNQEELGQLIGLLVGKTEFGKAATELLKDHIDIAGVLVTKLKAANDEKDKKKKKQLDLDAVKLRKDWTDNGNEIADALASVSKEKLSKADVRAAFQEHLDQTANEAVDLIGGNVASALTWLDAARRHMHEVGELLVKTYYKLYHQN
jgi:hypothetical protein